MTKLDEVEHQLREVLAELVTTRRAVRRLVATTAPAEHTQAHHRIRDLRQYCAKVVPFDEVHENGSLLARKRLLLGKRDKLVTMCRMADNDCTELQSQLTRLIGEARNRNASKRGKR